MKSLELRPLSVASVEKHEEEKRSFLWPCFPGTVSDFADVSFHFSKSSCLRVVQASASSTANICHPCHQLAPTLCAEALAFLSISSSGAGDHHRYGSEFTVSQVCYRVGRIDPSH